VTARRALDHDPSEPRNKKNRTLRHSWFILSYGVGRLHVDPCMRFDFFGNRGICTVVVGLLFWPLNRYEFYYSNDDPFARQLRALIVIYLLSLSLIFVIVFLRFSLSAMVNVCSGIIVRNRRRRSRTCSVFPEKALVCPTRASFWHE